MGIEPTGPAVHETQPALKTGRHTSTDPLPRSQKPSARALARQRLSALCAKTRVALLFARQQPTGNASFQSARNAPRPTTQLQAGTSCTRPRRLTFEAAAKGQALGLLIEIHR